MKQIIFKTQSLLAACFLGFVNPFTLSHAWADYSMSTPRFSSESANIATFLSQMNAKTLRNGENVWLRIKDGFQLNEVNASLVTAHEVRYTKNPEAFQRILARGQPYLFHILNEVELRGMPTEIALLPLVESAFNAQATSRVGAAGLWQFMPNTGRQYGLEQTSWYDGRRDVTAATRAALDYLEVLYSQFGDWSLALAAYNWGEGNLSRAIARNRAAGLPEDFEHLKLPNETRNYVPKLLAVRNILSQPAKFKVSLKKLPNLPYFTSVSIKKHIDLSLAAKFAETSEEELLKLNPAYKLPVFAYKSGRELLIPVEKLNVFEKNLSQHQAPLMSMQVYVTQADETSSEIAQRFGMDIKTFNQINRLSHNEKLAVARPVLVAANTLSSTVDETALSLDPQITSTASQNELYLMEKTLENQQAFEKLIAKHY